MNPVTTSSIKQKSFSSLNMIQFCETALTQVLPPSICKPESLVFISKAEHLKLALEKKASALIIEQKTYQQNQLEISKNISVWTTTHIQWAMSEVLILFDQNTPQLKQGIHSTALIHPTATVASSAHIGAYAVIEANAEVGENTIIYPHVYVGTNCKVGSNCIISSHSTIGSDGFGFFTDKTFKHHKIPQIGNVVIEDNCELGAHCAVDRATLTETRIKKGSKFDNFCHIAHNVTIGENAVVAAKFAVAGSTIIGNNFMSSGNVDITGHIKITDNVILSGRAAAINSIDEPGIYGGHPLEPHRESIKTLASLPQIKKLRKNVTKILKHLNLNQDEKEN